jgi:hypothetical protein
VSGVLRVEQGLQGVVALSVAVPEAEILIEALEV